MTLALLVCGFGMFVLGLFASRLLAFRLFLRALAKCSESIVVRSDCFTPQNVCFILLPFLFGIRYWLVAMSITIPVCWHKRLFQRLSIVVVSELRWWSFLGELFVLRKQRGGCFSVFVGFLGYGLPVSFVEESQKGLGGEAEGGQGRELVVGGVVSNVHQPCRQTDLGAKIGNTGGHRTALLQDIGQSVDTPHHRRAVLVPTAGGGATDDGPGVVPETKRQTIRCFDRMRKPVDTPKFPASRLVQSCHKAIDVVQTIHVESCVVCQEIGSRTQHVSYPIVFPAVSPWMETDMMTMMMETTTPCGLPVSPALLVGRRRHARVESEARVHAARLRGSGGSWFGASVFLPTEYPMSASPGNRPMRAAFVQAQNKFVAELEEGGGKKVVVSKLETDDEIEAFVQQAYNDVTQRRNKCKAQELRKILQQSRDAVLQSSTPRAAKRFCRMPSNTSPSPMSSSQMVCHASCCDSEIEGADAKGEDGSVAGSPKSSVVNVGDGGPSAATSTNSTVAEVTVDTASNPPAEEFSVRMRGVNKNKLWKVTLPSALFLEGTHEPRPSSSATIFLKTHYATEDEQTLKYVPYFGDDDKDDVVSDLYNLEDREKQMEFGPEYQERDTNDVIDETLILVQKRLADSGLDGKTDITTGAIPKRNTLQNRINDVLADIMDEYRSRVHERFEMVCRHGGKKSSAASPKKCTTKKLHSYLDAMDTYRPLFCRRCFVYDCNMHGNLNKPSLELQGELAVQKEREGFWSEEVGHAHDNCCRRTERDTANETIGW